MTTTPHKDPRTEANIDEYGFIVSAGEKNASSEYQPTLDESEQVIKWMYITSQWGTFTKEKQSKVSSFQQCLS